ncbi:MAG: selenium metabolism-associated LysR family transcriptional regulator [Terriglobales bacterium]
MENFRLKVFRVVAQHLNFRRAAEDLFISQPAVTQQIKTLEDEIGLPLFDRAAGRVALTSSGKILLRYAEKLKRTADEATQALAEASGQLAGGLSVGASQTIGQYLLPNLLAGFLRDNPRVEVTAMSGNTDTVLEALINHNIDIALIEGPGLRRDVVSEPFLEDQMVLVAPAGHEWAEQGITPSLLESAPLLMREQGSGSRRVVEQALEKAGLRKKDLRIRMTLDSTEGLLSAVEAGLGVAFVSRWAVRNQLTLGTLRVVRVEGLNLSRMFSVAYPIGPTPVGNVGAFRRFALANSYSLLPRVTGNPAAPKKKMKLKGFGGKTPLL